MGEPGRKTQHTHVGDQENPLTVTLRQNADTQTISFTATCQGLPAWMDMSWCCGEIAREQL